MRLFGRFGPLIGAIDEGASSVRFFVFAANTSEILTYHQVSLKQFSPQEGWVEQDATEILHATLECIEVTVDNLRKLEINPEDIVGIGITNQRETTIVWNSLTGTPLYSAIVSLDTRTSKIVDDLMRWKGLPNANAVAHTSGLPLSTYFSSVKLRWLLLNVTAVRDAVRAGECMAGTVDAWLIWNLTGGCGGGIHATDVTNASRTQLMSLRSLQWDKRLLRYFDIPQEILPKIKSSSEIYGYIASGALTGVPIAGCLGDQQATLLAHNCVKFGHAKCSYGNGCFFLYNTGDSIVHSQHGLATTVAYKLGADAPPVYALEASIAIAGSSLQWLKDNLEVIDDVQDLQSETEQATEEGNICFIPAFTGLYAPHWKKEARGIMWGVNSSTKPAHLVRAALEAVCQQVRAATSSAGADCIPPRRLLADGALSQADCLMQMQADLLAVPVVRPLVAESAALGAAAAAGRALRMWPAASPAPPADVFQPCSTDDERELRCAKWEEALQRCVNWDVDAEEAKQQVDSEPKTKDPSCALSPGLFFLGTTLLIILADKLKSI